MVYLNWRLRRNQGLERISITGRTSTAAGRGDEGAASDSTRAARERNTGADVKAGPGPHTSGVSVELRDERIR